MNPLTPKEIAKKYTKPDGSIEIPGNQRIIMPAKPSALSAISRAVKQNGAEVQL